MVGPADAYLTQTLAGRYRLIRHLADGNFSHVFRAIDQRSSALVAVKMLQPSAAVHPESTVEFKHEGELLERLARGSNVVGLLDSGNTQITVEINGQSVPLSVSFHVMELADGALSELLPLYDELDWRRRLHIFRDVVVGAHQMHLQRIMHRDLKASNVLLFDTETARVVAKVSDLGRSRDLRLPPRFDVDAYAAGRGDMSHAPPEHLWHLGLTDDMALRQADIYLAGSVLFELGTGVGITSLTFTDWLAHSHAAASMNPQDRETAFRAAGRLMAAAYEDALGVLADESPKVIRHLVVDLVRQMCHPNPARRERRFRVERKNPVWGLQWVIRRVDIIIKSLEKSRAMNSSRRDRRRL